MEMQGRVTMNAALITETVPNDFKNFMLTTVDCEVRHDSQNETPTLNEQEDFIDTAIKFQAENIVSKHLTKLYKKGAMFECYILLWLRKLIEKQGLTDKLRIISNPYTAKKYMARTKHHVDLKILIKTFYGWKETAHLELKNWSPRYCSIAMATTHILTRFQHTTGNISKYLITVGIKTTKPLQTFLSNNNIHWLPLQPLVTQLKTILQHIQTQIPTKTKQKDYTSDIKQASTTDSGAACFTKNIIGANQHCQLPQS